MFHVVLSLASRMLYLGNVLQGFAHRILSLRSLEIISSHLIPTLPAPPPLALLDAPVSFEEPIISPCPSVGPFAVERQSQAFSSSIPSYQSSLIAVTPSQFLQFFFEFLPLLVVLAAISGFVIIVPEIVCSFTSIVKTSSAVTHSSSFIAKLFRSKPTFRLLPANLPSQLASSKLPISLISLLLLWTGPPAVASFFTFIWFISILLSFEQSSNMIVTTLQWCGLLTVQDTRTPPLLDAIYEQITRSATDNNDLVFTDSVGYSHLADQLAAQTRDLQNAQIRRENQEREPSRPSSTKSADSQNSVYRQLEISRAHEQSLHANLFATEQERESLKALISTLEASLREQRRREEIAEVSRTRRTEAEVAASRRAAEDRICDMKKQLSEQRKLAFRKDTTIQSITRESQLAHTKLKRAESKITRLDEKLRDERDRRLRETKKLLDERATLRASHESEMRRLTQEAEDALRDARLQSLLDRDHPRHRPPTPAWPCDTGQGPLLPERILDTGTLPIGSATNPDSSSHSTGQSPRSPNQDELDYTARLVAPWLEIPSMFDMESDVAKEQHALLKEFIERMREGESDSGVAVSPAANPDSSSRSTGQSPRSPDQDELDYTARLVAPWLEIPSMFDMESEVAKEQNAKLKELIDLMREGDPPGTQVVKPNEHDKLVRLQEEMVVTKERLRLSEEEVRDVRCQLEQSKETLREVETQVMTLEYESEICQATLREAQDARHASDVKFAEADQLLRLRQAESESFVARAEESEFKSSQVRFLCAALQERVTELEDQVKELKSAQKHPSTTATHAKSRSHCPTVAHTDPAITQNYITQDFDSIYMTISPSIPRLLDLPLPPSLPSSDSFYEKCPEIPLADADSSSFYFMRQKCLAVRPTSHPAASDPDSDSQIIRSSSEDFSLPLFELPRAFLSKGNSFGSMDWPPIGSSLSPGDENARRDGVLETRSVSEVKFTEADQLLCLRQAESESSVDRAEESEFKSSQVRFLCAALQERLTELEDQVKKLKSTQKHPATTATHAESRSHTPTVTHTDPAITHNSITQDSNSIYMTVSPSIPRLLDLSLPPSLSSSDSFYQKCPAIPLADADSCLFGPAPSDPESYTVDSVYMITLPSLPCILDFSLPPSPSPCSTSSLYSMRQKCLAIRPTSRPAASDDSDPDPDSQIIRPSSEDFSLPPFELPRASLSKGNSFGSMDWPPIGSSLFPGDGSARRDGVPETRSVVSDDDRENPSWVPIWAPDYPPSLAPPTDERRVDISPRLDREVTYPLQHACRTSGASTGASIHLPPPPRIADLAFPIFSPITLPPLSLPPAGSHETLPAELHFASSVTRNDYNPGGVTPNGTPLSIFKHCVPGDFVPSNGWVDPKWQVPDLEDIYFDIPADCPTSTPMASRRRTSEKSSLYLVRRL